MNSISESLLMIGGSAVLAVAGGFVVRKRISREVLEQCHEVGGIMLAIVGTLYAIVVGLIVVSSQSKVDQASQMAVKESNMLTNIYHLAHTFKQPTSHRIREAVHEYAIAVVEQDWSRVEEEKEKEATIPSYQKIWSEVTNYNPKDNNESQAYATMLGNIEDLASARKFRMVAAKTGLSPVFWGVLVAGGVLIILFTYFFFVESALAQTIMTSIVAIFIAMNVYLIYICQNPYRPEFSVKETGFGFSFTPNWFKDNQKNALPKSPEVKDGATAQPTPQENDTSANKEEKSEKRSVSFAIHDGGT